MAGPPSDPNRCKIVAVTTDHDTAKRAQALLGARSIQTPKPAQPHHKQQYVVTRSGDPARRLMAAVHPHMSKRRQEAIVKAIARPKPSVRATLTLDQADEVRSLRSDGSTPQEVVDHMREAHGLEITRSVVWATQRGYRASQLVPVSGEQMLSELA